VLRPGMVLAIEPMVNLGGGETVALDDGWTVVTKDSSLSAHFEHSVAVTAQGYEICRVPATPRTCGVIPWSMDSPARRAWRSSDEGARISQAHVPQLQDHPAARRDHGHL